MLWDLKKCFGISKNALGSQNVLDKVVDIVDTVDIIESVHAIVMVDIVDIVDIVDMLTRNPCGFRGYPISKNVNG